jgi:hypothetical protein
MAEYAYGILGDSQPKEIVDAAQLLCQQKKTGEIPTVVKAAEHFLAKQEKRQLSEATMRDYQRLVKVLAAEFPTQKLSDIYTKAVIQFYSGRHNSHCNGVPWVRRQRRSTTHRVLAGRAARLVGGL